MLNLPSVVIGLFRTDTVVKNFRVHFPNGERADIVNDQIVRESLSFTESVCSQEELKFGLTESSMIEFETVGVENIRGLIIECGIEVDTSSLTAAQISTIQSGSYDGTLVLAVDSDLPYGFYRIPLGIFRVDSCPRNQQAMTHRRIKAYSLSMEMASGNPFELKKLSLLLPGGNVYEPPAKKFFYSSIGFNNQQVMSDYTRSAVVLSGMQTAIPSITVTLVDSSTATLELEVHYNTSDRTAHQAFDFFAVDTHGYDYSSVIDELGTFLDGLGVDPVASGYYDMPNMVTEICKRNALPAVHYFYTTGGNTYDLDQVNILTTNNAVLPYRKGLTYSFTRPTSVTAMISIGSQFESHSINFSTPADIYLLTDTAAAGPLDGITVSFAQTLEQNRTFAGAGTYLSWSFIDAVDLLDFANGWLELLASFGRVSRTGGIEIIRLDNTSPILISPDDTDDLWWDESTTEKIGSAIFVYNDGNEDQTVEYSISSGAIEYDLTNNAVLAALKNPTVAAINNLIKTAFVPGLSKTAYVPIDLRIRYLPHIEAGDSLTITAVDGTTVSSYAMNQHVEGIQALFSTIESKGEV